MLPKRRCLLFLVPLLALVALTGCNGQGTDPNGPKPTLCQKAQATYNYFQAADTTAESGVAALQAQLDALPLNDPARKTLEGPLAKARTTLAQIQTYLTLAKVTLMAICPDAGSVPAPPPGNVPIPITPPTPPPTPVPIPQP